MPSTPPVRKPGYPLGPGKAAVRLNALTYGLRARSILISGEDPADYQQLWADLEAEWDPQTRTERLHLEQMSTSQWLLARMAKVESRIYRRTCQPKNSWPAGSRFHATRAPGAFLHQCLAGPEAVTTGAAGPAPAAAARTNRAGRATAGSPASRAKGSAPRLCDVGGYRGPSGLLLRRHPR